jgi:hypothetical protein
VRAGWKDGVAMTDRQVLTNVRDLSSLELMEAHSKAQE